MATQKEIASRLGVTPQMISKWKKGQSGLKVKTALKWSKILDVSFEKIMTATPRERLKILGLKE